MTIKNGKFGEQNATKDANIRFFRTEKQGF